MNPRPILLVAQAAVQHPAAVGSPSARNHAEKWCGKNDLLPKEHPCWALPYLSKVSITENRHASSLLPRILLESSHHLKTPLINPPNPHPRMQKRTCQQASQSMLAPLIPHGV